MVRSKVIDIDVYTNNLGSFSSILYFWRPAVVVFITLVAICLVACSWPVVNAPIHEYAYPHDQT
jgi:hypothetical protein